MVIKQSNSRYGSERKTYVSLSRNHAGVVYIYIYIYIYLFIFSLDCDLYQVLSSIFFLFFACLAPAVAFGGLLGVVTGGAMGTIEASRRRSGSLKPVVPGLSPVDHQRP